MASWNTEEFCRIIANDEYLYNARARIRSLEGWLEFCDEIWGEGGSVDQYGCVYTRTAAVAAWRDR